MADRSELDDYESGLASPFWNTFRQHVLDEWGPAGARYMAAVKLAASKDDAVAMNHLRCVLFTHDELEKLMRWPYEKLREMKQRAPAAPSQSRRGPL